MSVKESLIIKRNQPILVASQPLFSTPDSQFVTASQFYEPEFKRWLSYYSDNVVLDRKIWEYCYILQSISVYAGYSEGSRGLGFGAGKELLPSIMAKMGCDIVATDYIPNDEKSLGWETKSIDDLFFGHIISREEFDASISFREVDMNSIPGDLREFDFTWSTGSLEHIGGHAQGLNFVENSLACLKSGGIAVHTTEFTLTSDHVGQDGPSSFRVERDIHNDCW